MASEEFITKTPWELGGESWQHYKDPSASHSCSPWGSRATEWIEISSQKLAPLRDLILFVVQTLLWHNVIFVFTSAVCSRTLKTSAVIM